MKICLIPSLRRSLLSHINPHSSFIILARIFLTADQLITCTAQCWQQLKHKIKKGTVLLRGDLCLKFGQFIVRPSCTTIRFEILATVSLNSHGLFTTSALVMTLSLTISMHHGAARDIRASPTMPLVHQTTHLNHAMRFSRTQNRTARYPCGKLAAGKLQALQKTRTRQASRLCLVVTNIWKSSRPKQNGANRTLNEEVVSCGISWPITLNCTTASGKTGRHALKTLFETTM